MILRLTFMCEANWEAKHLEFKNAFSDMILLSNYFSG